MDKYNEVENLKKALEICINAKMRRTGICGAAETILLHQKIATSFGSDLIAKLSSLNCEVRGCKKTLALDQYVIPAIEEDWSTEYLAPIISIKSTRKRKPVAPPGSPFAPLCTPDSQRFI